MAEDIGIIITWILFIASYIFLSGLWGYVEAKGGKKVYSKDYELRYRIEDKKIYDKDWNLKYRIQDGKVYDKNWNLKFRIEDMEKMDKSLPHDFYRKPGEF